MTSAAMTAELPTEKAQQAETVLRRCVCLVLRCNYLGNHKKVDLAGMRMAKVADGTEQALTEVEKKQLRASKLLVDNKHLQACTREIGAVKEFLRARSAAMGHRVFGAGTFLIVIADLLTVETELKARLVSVGEHAKALADRWGEIVAERRQDLGPMFNAQEYATADEVGAAFGFDWSYVSFSAPEQLLDMDRGIFEAAQAKHEQKLAEAYDEIVLQMREGALTVARQLADRLRPGPDGKPKAIRGTALRDLQEYVALLPQRNVTADVALEQAVGRLAEVAEGVTPDMLKSAPALRQALQQAAEAASRELEGLVATASARAISFGPIPAGA